MGLVCSAWCAAQRAVLLTSWSLAALAMAGFEAVAGLGSEADRIHPQKWHMWASRACCDTYHTLCGTHSLSCGLSISGVVVVGHVPTCSA